MQCNYNSFIQIINFHWLFRNAPRCRKTGACRILMSLRYMYLFTSTDLLKLQVIIQNNVSLFWCLMWHWYTLQKIDSCQLCQICPNCTLICFKMIIHLCQLLESIQIIQNGWTPCLHAAIPVWLVWFNVYKHLQLQRQCLHSSLVFAASNPDLTSLH